MRIHVMPGVALAVIGLSACGGSHTSASPSATTTVTATATVTAIPSPSAAPLPTPTPTPTVDQATQQAAALARQACQSFTDAFVKGPSTLYFPRAAALGGQAAQRDVRWATLSSDIAAAGSNASASIYS